MNQQKQSFMDPKTLFAIALTGVVFIAWNNYIKTKYPAPQAVVESSENGTAVEGSEEQAVSPGDSVGKESVVTNTASGIDQKKVSVVKTASDRLTAEETLQYEDKYWQFDISSYGMGVKNLRLSNYFNRDFEPKHFGTEQSPLPLESNLTGRSEPLNFKVQQIGDKTFSGVAYYNGATINKVVIVNSENYSFDTTVTITNMNDTVVGLTTYLSEPLINREAGGLLSANRFDHQEFYVSYGSDSEREIIDPSQSANFTYSGISAASLGEQYFAQGFYNRGDILPDLKAKVDVENKVGLSSISYPILNKKEPLRVSYVGYMGPKSLTHLSSVDSSMAQVIDFGFFSFIAKPILMMLQFFNQFIGNWGFSIIALTIFVRFLVLPLHVSSYRSMKNMSKVSPLIKKINEQYKNDPTTKNQKIMEVYKEQKINPIGGCLPMLLQMPVFFALYQVLGQSIELYQAPFIFWIQDLSSKDPYYVLPVLMGITMFFQMKTTPSTMDETQRKIMMIMPFMFAIFMVALPSGLTLYIFISGVFGVIQQYLMRDKSDSAAASGK